MNQPAVYVNLVEDVVVSSTATGGVRTTVLTPKQYWGMGINLAEVTGGLRIRPGFDAGVGITLKWQWSLDGKTWKPASASGNRWGGAGGGACEDPPEAVLVSKCAERMSKEDADKGCLVVSANVAGSMRTADGDCFYNIACTMDCPDEKDEPEPAEGHTAAQSTSPWY